MLGFISNFRLKIAQKMASSLAAGVQTRIEKVFLTTRNVTCEYGQNCYRRKPEHLRYKTHVHCRQFFLTIILFLIFPLIFFII